MGTVLPVGIVEALQNRCAQLLGGVTTGILGGYLSAALSAGSLLCFVNVVGSGVTMGQQLQCGHCSGACCSCAGSDSISVK